MERVVSSANNLALVVWRHLGKSLIYKRNKNGPRLDPCGTPHLNSFTSDCLPLRLQDTLFGVLRKIATRAQNQSEFHQIFTKCSPVHAKYGKVVKLTNNKIT
jgi:hypothetical protein